jgi:muramoyltetrapeptide carboxypeptidase LdcA involved in peptidoglycan recycling
MFSDEANNFGTLVSGVSTFILAILAIATYWRWHTEKRAEKLSDIAESALNHLDIFKDRIEDWAKFANTWFIYNRQSTENKQNLDRKRPTYPSQGWHWHNKQNGVIEGRLWGGCLEVLSFHLSVRKYLPDFEKLNGTILFIETSEEMPAQELVYCFIAALAKIGLLKKFKAILMAYPKAQFCDQQPPEGREAYIANQQNAVKNALSDYGSNIPVIFNMNFGHTDPQMVIPNGGNVTINFKNETIRFS